jgi:hypothetical protein
MIAFLVGVAVLAGPAYLVYAFHGLAVRYSAAVTR